jgi:hypothetical protein
MNRSVLVLVLVGLLSACAQELDNGTGEVEMCLDRQEIVDAVNMIFVMTDERRWDEVVTHFADRVFLDYSSKNGGEPAILSPHEIVESWKRTLSGFESTHHQLGNHLVKMSGNQADMFCYGTASLYLPNDQDENLLTVVGTYDFHLLKADAKWKVDKMRFNFKYQDGNASLRALAQKKVSPDS